MTPPPEPAKEREIALRDFLMCEGWHRYESHSRCEKEYWCKRWKDAPVCQCNDTKEGIQVTLKVHEYQGRESYEIEVVGEKRDGVWVNLSAYSLGDEIISILYDQANQLVAAWTHLNSFTPQSETKGAR